MQGFKHTVSRFAQQQFKQTILRPGVEAEVFVQVFNGDTEHVTKRPRRHV